MPDFINYKDYPKVGYPVNPISGIKFLNDEMDLDFVLPGYLSLRWQRSYFSDNSYVGWLGQGWNLPFSCHLLRNKKQITFINEQGSAIDFPRINESERYYHRQENLILEREENGRHSIILPSGDERYLFAPLTVNADDPTGNRAEFLPLIAIQDANGNVIRVVYQSLGLPKLLQDSVGRLLLFNFNSVNCQDNQLSPRLTQVRLVNAKGSPSELLVGYEYDNKGDLVAVVNAEGQVTRRFSYINHILTEHAQPGGRIVSYQYDKYTPNGKVLRQTTNLGQRWLFDYSENTTKATDPLNRITNYQFDINRTFTGFIDALNQRSEVESDTLGRMTRLRVANNRIIDKHYNRYGRLTSSVDPSGLRCCYNYDYQQRLTCSTDVLQQTTRYEYSDQGDQFSIINPLGYRTDYFINSQGLVEKIQDESRVILQLNYNKIGQLTSLLDCSGYATKISYPEQGRIEVTHSDSSVTRWQFNQYDKPLSIQYSDGTLLFSEYDQLGRLVAAGNGTGAKTRWQLEPDGLLQNRINQYGAVFSYFYDAARRLKRLVNENGATYTLDYDHNDNLIREQCFGQLLTHYRYSSLGQIIEKLEIGQAEKSNTNVQSQTGIKTSLRYNSQGEVIETIICNLNEGTEEQQHFAYNAAGQLILAKNAISSVSREYDQLGQLISESLEFAGKTHTVRHTYTQYGKRSKTRLPNGTEIDYLYYGTGHLLQINIDGVCLCEIERDNMHREISRSQGNLISHFQYNATGKLTSQQVFFRSNYDEFQAPIISRQYHYNSVGNLELTRDNKEGTTRYQYDSLNRLTGAGEESYYYDPCNNLISSDGSPLIDNRINHYQQCDYRYDRYGNLQQKNIVNGGQLQFQYNTEHQLKSVVKRENQLTEISNYYYDALGRRISKTKGSVTQLFFWDEDRLLSESSAEQSILYVYEPSGFIPLAQQITSASNTKKIYYYHNDQIGTPHAVTSREGGVVWRSNSNVWGNRRNASQQLDEFKRHPQPLCFQGQYYDAETGLHYNRYRYYDPVIGRYITPDPLGLAGGENSYLYSTNPNTWVDPLGLITSPGGSGVPAFTEGSIGAANYKFDQRSKNLNIKTHGMPFVTQTDRLVNGSNLAKQVKGVIAQNGGEVNRVTLQSCFSAAGGPASQAQQLANKLGKPVTGYTGKFTEVVRAGVAAPQGASGGITRTFLPTTSNITRNVTSALNNSGSAASRGVSQISKIFKRPG